MRVAFDIGSSSGALGHILYDEASQPEGRTRRSSYRRRGIILSAAMLVLALTLLVLSIALPISPAAGGAYFSAALVLVPLGLAIAAAWAALNVGFRRVYEGGIVDAKAHGKPRVWLSRDITKVLLIVQPDGDTLIGIELRNGAGSRRNAVVHVRLGQASDMAAFPKFKEALEGRVPIETARGAVL